MNRITLILITHLFYYVSVTPRILQSQFIEKDFKKTEAAEDNVVILLLVFFFSFSFYAGW